MRGSKSDLPVTVETPDGGTLRQADRGGMTIELGAFNAGMDPSASSAGQRTAA